MKGKMLHMKHLKSLNCHVNRTSSHADPKPMDNFAWESVFFACDLLQCNSATIPTFKLYLILHPWDTVERFHTEQKLQTPIPWWKKKEKKRKKKENLMPSCKENQESSTKQFSTHDCKYFQFSSFWTTRNLFHGKCSEASDGVMSYFHPT